ncbi:MAG: transglutaminase-like domain-containing protein [Spirochaetota bacterium]|nr:transglutaminase-like domain-containing protein [Spirochaetota bacterium]
MTKLLCELHHSATKDNKHVLLFIVESLVFLYIIWWIDQRISPGTPLVFMMGIYLMSSYLGMLFSFSELRFYVAFFVYMLFHIALYSLCYLFISGLQLYNSEYFEFTLFFLQKHFLLLGIISLLGFTFKWFLFRFRFFFYIEVLLSLSLMVLLLKVHRDYALSTLNLFDSFLSLGFSEIMIFFLFVLVFFVLVTLLFFFEEEGSPHKPHRFSAMKRRSRIIKSAIGLFTLLIIVSLFMYHRVKEEEPRQSAGIPQQFNENDFLDLYPKVNMNVRERKLIVKMEIQELENFVGRYVPADNQYIRWKVLSGYDPDKNLFKYQKNPYETDIPPDSEDHYFKAQKDKQKVEFKADPEKLLLGLGQLLTFQNYALADNLINRLTAQKAIPSKKYPNRNNLDQEYYIIRFPKAANLAMNTPTLIKPIKNKNLSLFTTSYRAKSQIFTGDIDPLLTITDYSGLDKAFMDYYTAGPANPDYKNLAERLTENHNTPLLKVIALIDHLTREYSYSLSPGGENKADLLHYFLFTNKKGYCTYFAFALTALTRSLKIPSRVVVGFLTDPYNKKENYYLLHAKNMHAWVEVYFKEYGWITFDGTANAPFGTNFHSDMDYLNNLIESLEKETEDEKLSKDQLDKEKWLQNEDKTNYWLIVLSGLPFIFLTIFSYKSYYRLKCQREQSPLKKIYFSFHLVQKTLQDLFIRRKPDETHQQYAQRLYHTADIDTRQLTTLFLTAKYNNKLPDDWPDLLKASLASWNTSLKKRFPFWKLILAGFNISFFLKRRD